MHMENRGRSSPDHKRFSPAAYIPLVILLGAAACTPQPTPDQSEMATYVAGQKTAAAGLEAKQYAKPFVCGYRQPDTRSTG